MVTDGSGWSIQVQSPKILDLARTNWFIETDIKIIFE